MPRPASQASTTVVSRTSFGSLQSPGMIDECERRKVVELRCVSGKFRHSAEGGKDGAAGALGRKSGYELLQPVLTIIFAGGIECVGQAIRAKNNHVTVAHRYRLSQVRRIPLNPHRHARGR